MNFKEKYNNGVKGLNYLSVGLNYKCGVCQDIFELSESEMKVKLFNGTLFDEPEFSKESCDICNSSLAGNRYIAHGKDSRNNIIHLEICEDCVMYMETGEVSLG